MSIGSSDSDVHCPQVDIRVQSERTWVAIGYGRIRPHNYMKEIQGS